MKTIGAFDFLFRHIQRATKAARIGIPVSPGIKNLGGVMDVLGGGESVVRMIVTDGAITTTQMVSDMWFLAASYMTKLMLYVTGASLEPLHVIAPFVHEPESARKESM